MRAAATVQRAVRLDVGRGATEDALHRLEAIGEYAVAAALIADEGPSLLLRGHGVPVREFAVAHPSAIEVNPGSWFAVALERWFAGDVDDRGAVARADPARAAARHRAERACSRRAPG